MKTCPTLSRYAKQIAKIKSLKGCICGLHKWKDPKGLTLRCERCGKIDCRWARIHNATAQRGFVEADGCREVGQ